MQRRAAILACAVFASLCSQSWTLGAIQATATYASQQVGSNFTYTLTLTNTSTASEPIGTFWFAWIPRTVIGVPYDFLPHIPSVSSPAGWTGSYEVDGITPPGGGAAIEWYDTGTALAAGQSLSGFSFTTPDPPSTIGGTSFFDGYPVATSWVYMGVLQNGNTPSDQGSQFTAQSVPEPSLVLLVPAGLLLARRRSR